MRKILQDNINARNTREFRESSDQCAKVGVAVRNDKQLNNLLSFVTIAQGGMLPNIH